MVGRLARPKKSGGLTNRLQPYRIQAIWAGCKFWTESGGLVIASGCSLGPVKNGKGALYRRPGEQGPLGLRERSLR